HALILPLFYLLLRLPPSSPLFPYTTLFRSARQRESQGVGAAARQMLLVAGSAIAGAHHVGVGFPAGAVVVAHLDCAGEAPPLRPDRKSTRLNSSHVAISYAVFCLKKKNKKK